MKKHTVSRGSLYNDYVYYTNYVRARTKAYKLYVFLSCKYPLFTVYENIEASIKEKRNPKIVTFTIQ